MLRDDYDEESQFTTDFNFIDEDGEVVWVHTKEMALISVPEQLIARERTAEEWDAMTAEATPVTAPKPVTGVASAVIASHSSAVRSRAINCSGTEINAISFEA